MSTRQDLIERDCMDRLGWDVHRVAMATEEEMLRALAEFESRRSPVASTHPPAPKSVQADCPDLQLVHNLRESLRMKTMHLQSGDVMDDDVDRLRTSANRTQQRLDSVVAALRKRLGGVRAEEKKKRQLHTLLQHVVQSVGDEDDRAHMNATHKRLTELADEVDRLAAVLGDS